MTYEVNKFYEPCDGISLMILARPDGLYQGTARVRGKNFFGKIYQSKEEALQVLSYAFSMTIDSTLEDDTEKAAVEGFTAAAVFFNQDPLRPGGVII